MSTYREFAERILFSASLEAKLEGPSTSLVDEDRGSACDELEMPHRPAELRFSAIGERGPKAREDRLGEERERGLLLHFFCNHELLATELMALALLKFPDAPAEFRKGLLRTLREEQQHTQWYLRRMADCGVSFGEYPVNGFFWRSIAQMATPLDYVSRLSLTFEQANLDYAKHYAERFAEAGDGTTAQLLQQIYKDEIAHVGYGLKWFRKWKGVARSDWQAFQDMLPFPLSPARAKGTVQFNAEGRRKAGLDPQFIAALELYSQSRGRTPWLYVFNPGAEAAAEANDASAIDSATKQLTKDLDTLGLFLAKSEDVVLLHKQPRVEFLRELKEMGVEIPAQEILEAGKLSKSSPLRERKLGKLRPWGWSADAHELLQELLPNLTADPVESPWNERTRMLYSKSTAAACLSKLPWQELFGDRSIIGSETTTIASLWAGGKTALMKANFGIAGRSMAKFPPDSDVSASQQLLNLPGGVIVEPWLERVADFSAQYECEPNQLPRLKGLVRLHCDAHGRFQACAASGTFTRLLPQTVARVLHEQGTHWIKELYNETIPQVLGEFIQGTGFRGSLGIDAFFYRDPAGHIRLKPIVEINPRFTMGRTTLELLRVAAPGKTVLFRIFSKRAVQKLGWKSLSETAAVLREQFPQVKSADGHIAAGCFFLNDPELSTAFLAAAYVTDRVCEPDAFMPSKR
jgi:uncharacterized ferritin-like protein (DUF455 family)